MTEAPRAQEWKLPMPIRFCRVKELRIEMSTDKLGCLNFENSRVNDYAIKGYR